MNLRDQISLYLSTSLAIVMGIPHAAQSQTIDEIKPSEVDQRTQEESKTDGGPKPPEGLMLGLGYGTRASQFKGVSYASMLLPLVQYSNKYFTIAGLGATAHVYRDSKVTVGMSLIYGLGEGHSDSDSYIFEGMDTRRASMWLGSGISWRLENSHITIGLQGDVAGASNGIKASLQYSREIHLGPILISPNVGATWFNNDYVNYYYGVRSSEARVDRSAYAPGSATNFNVGIRGMYFLAKRDGFFVDFSFIQAGDSIANSPLVSGRTSSIVQLGYTHRY